MSRLGRSPGDARGDEGRGVSGGLRNACWRRSVGWLALWLSAVALLLRLCVGEDDGELSAKDVRLDSRPAMYADERSVAGAVTTGWGSSGMSVPP